MDSKKRQTITCLVPVAAGIVLFFAGTLADGRIDGREVVALGVVILLVGTIVATRMRVITHPSAAAYELGYREGYEQGYALGYAEGRRVGKPTLLDFTPDDEDERPGGPRRSTGREDTA